MLMIKVSTVPYSYAGAVRSFPLLSLAYAPVHSIPNYTKNRQCNALCKRFHETLALHIWYRYETHGIIPCELSTGGKMCWHYAPRIPK